MMRPATLRLLCVSKNTVAWCVTFPIELILPAIIHLLKKQRALKPCCLSHTTQSLIWKLLSDQEQGLADKHYMFIEREAIVISHSYTSLVTVGFKTLESEATRTSGISV
ncbi:hypothetical protein Y1Q_0024121 [Alligator mississippiensis]|uniref:Uncharacterized protein n=1 Tax=Alligator mississippiensis TaxID=8496 RepID=A0A151NHT2_ALLMI|nr:hypothetical protein Y1Q_0024121 [Alligator mississippiensis]